MLGAKSRVDSLSRACESPSCSPSPRSDRLCQRRSPGPSSWDPLGRAPRRSTVLPSRSNKYAKGFPRRPSVDLCRCRYSVKVTSFRNDRSSKNIQSDLLSRNHVMTVRWEWDDPHQGRWSEWTPLRHCSVFDLPTHSVSSASDGSSASTYFVHFVHISFIHAGGATSSALLFIVCVKNWFLP